jgi:hypothetical protein
MAKNIATIPESTSFAVMTYDPSDLAEVMRENFGGRGINWLQLERIKVPAGGGIAWEVETDEGNDAIKELDGIILIRRDQRTYFKDAFGSGDKGPPDCYSTDLERGIGDPGGPCASCPFAQFGSARRPDGSAGNGQACRQQNVLFFLRPDSLIPSVVMVPPSSLRTMGNHMRRLASQGLPYFKALTRLTLVKATSGDGITYAQIEARKIDAVPDDLLQRVQAMRKSLNGIKAPVDPETGEVLREVA